MSRGRSSAQGSARRACARAQEKEEAGRGRPAAAWFYLMNRAARARGEDDAGGGVCTRPQQQPPLLLAAGRASQSGNPVRERARVPSSTQPWPAPRFGTGVGVAAVLGAGGRAHLPRGWVGCVGMGGGGTHAVAAPGTSGDNVFSRAIIAHQKEP